MVPLGVPLPAPTQRDSSGTAAGPRAGLAAPERYL